MKTNGNTKGIVIGRHVLSANLNLRSVIERLRMEGKHKKISPVMANIIQDLLDTMPEDDTLYIRHNNRLFVILTEEAYMKLNGGN